MVSDGMYSITFYHFFTSDLDGMKKLLYSIMKYPNNTIKYLFYSTRFRSIPSHDTLFHSILFIVSKHSLNLKAGKKMLNDSVCDEAKG